MVLIHPIVAIGYYFTGLQENVLVLTSADMMYHFKHGRA